MKPGEPTSSDQAFVLLRVWKKGAEDPSSEVELLLTDEYMQFDPATDHFQFGSPDDPNSETVYELRISAAMVRELAENLLYRIAP